VRPSPLSHDPLLEGGLVQLRLGEEALQLCILLLKRSQPFGLGDLKAAVLRLPAVNSVLGNAMTACQIRGGGISLLLFQDRDGLLWYIAFASFRDFPRSQSIGESHIPGSLNYGDTVNDPSHQLECYVDRYWIVRCMEGEGAGLYRFLENF